MASFDRLAGFDVPTPVAPVFHPTRPGRAVRSAAVEIFDGFFDPSSGFEFLSRFGHILSGVTWIGLLYFFNFVQVPAYAQLSDSARSEALRKLTWRALWWFRWAAVATLVFGLLIISVHTGETDAGDSRMELFFSGQHGVAILTGMLFGVTMFLNVWGVIWRAQKVVIGSAETVASGGEADPDAPAAAKRGARASRANTLFSIPMLFFMVFAPHGGAWFGGGTEGTIVYWIIVLALWAFIEASALGFIGGIDSPFNQNAFNDHRRTIAAGFILLAIIYFIGWELLLAP
jgi:hypothetical protein